MVVLSDFVLLCFLTILNDLQKSCPLRRKVGSGEANYFGRYVSDFQGLVSVGEGEHGEIAGGAVQEDWFNNTLVQTEQEVGFD